MERIRDNKLGIMETAQPLFHGRLYAFGYRGGLIFHFRIDPERSKFPFFGYSFN